MFFDLFSCFWHFGKIPYKMHKNKDSNAKKRWRRERAQLRRNAKLGKSLARAHHFLLVGCCLRLRLCLLMAKIQLGRRCWAGGSPEVRVPTGVDDQECLRQERAQLRRNFKLGKSLARAHHFLLVGCCVRLRLCLLMAKIQLGRRCWAGGCPEVRVPTGVDDQECLPQERAQLRRNVKLRAGHKHARMIP